MVVGSIRTRRLRDREEIPHDHMLQNSSGTDQECCKHIQGTVSCPASHAITGRPSRGRYPARQETTSIPSTACERRCRCKGTHRISG